MIIYILVQNRVIYCDNARDFQFLIFIETIVEALLISNFMKIFIR